MNSTLTKKSWLMEGSTEVEVIRGSYLWNVKNFTFLSTEKTMMIKSPSFSLGGKNEYKWRLRMYPNGCNQQNTDHPYIGLFLQMLSRSDTDVNAKVTFSIVKSNGQQHILAKDTIRNYKRFKSRGYNELISRILVQGETHGFLHNGDLRILCEVTIGTGVIVTQPSVAEPDKTKPVLTLLQNLQSLLENKTLSDTVIISEGQQFHVHKAVLAARSPVFAAMFEHDMLEKNENTVEINDISKDVLEQLIRFIYTGSVEPLPELVQGLLEAADKYALDELKRICEAAISKKLTVDNVIETLVIADRHNSLTLKEHAIHFMKANAVRLVDNFKNLLLNNVSGGVSSDSISE